MAVFYAEPFPPPLRAVYADDLIHDPFELNRTGVEWPFVHRREQPGAPHFVCHVQVTAHTSSTQTQALNRYSLLFLLHSFLVSFMYISATSIMWQIDDNAFARYHNKITVLKTVRSLTCLSECVLFNSRCRATLTRQASSNPVAQQARIPPTAAP